jgi:hypothetical protein
MSASRNRCCRRAGEEGNEKTLKVNRGLFKRELNFNAGFLNGQKAVFLDFNSICSLVLDKSKVGENGLLKKSKDPRFLS